MNWNKEIVLEVIVVTIVVAILVAMILPALKRCRREAIKGVIEIESKRNQDGLQPISNLENLYIYREKLDTVIKKAEKKTKSVDKVTPRGW